MGPPGARRFLGLVLDAVAEAGASPPQEIPTGPDFFRFSVDAEFDALLREQGLEDRTVRTIAFTHRAGSADEVWEGMLDGTVRTSALILDSRRRPSGGSGSSSIG